MDGDSLSKEAFNEYAKRIDEENHRQNVRISNLEDTIKQMSDLTSSVKELAMNMTSMVKEQEKQGKRLEVLEGQDGEKWRKVTSYIATVIIGIVIGFIFKQLGM